MARPRKEGMDYFPHDVNLSTDKKVEALRILHGNDGYTFFCIVLENIYQEPNFELDVSDAETIQILAKKVEVTPQKLSEMIKTAIKHHCFDRERYINDGVLTSNGIKKRASVVVKKREAMRNYHNCNVSGGVSDAETREESTQSKRKVKDKVKEKNKRIREEKQAYADNVLLTPKQYETLLKKHGEEKTKAIIDKLNDYKIGTGKSYDSDYLAITRWVVKSVDESKKPSNIVQGNFQTNDRPVERKVASLYD